MTYSMPPCMLMHNDVVRFVWRDKVVEGPVTAIGKRHMANNFRPVEWEITVGNATAVFARDDRITVLTMFDADNPARVRNDPRHWAGFRISSHPTP